MVDKMTESDADEDLLDPIRLWHSEQDRVCNVTPLSKGSKIAGYISADLDGEVFIEQEKNSATERDRRGSVGLISLQVSFFDNTKNVQLLNRCQPLRITLVDFDKYPSYFREFIKFRNGKAVKLNFVTNNKDCNDHHSQNVTAYTDEEKVKDLNHIATTSPTSENSDMSDLEKQMSKPKIRPVDIMSYIRHNKVDSSKIHNSMKQGVIQNINNFQIQKLISSGQTKVPKIDFKKNIGLVGLKVMSIGKAVLNREIKKREVDKVSKVTCKKKLCDFFEKSICDNTKIISTTKEMSQSTKRNVLQVGRKSILSEKHEQCKKFIEKDKQIYPKNQDYQNHEVFPSKNVDKLQSVNVKDMRKTREFNKKLKNLNSIVNNIDKKLKYKSKRKVTETEKVSQCSTIDGIKELKTKLNQNKPRKYIQRPAKIKVVEDTHNKSDRLLITDIHIKKNVEKNNLNSVTINSIPTVGNCQSNTFYIKKTASQSELKSTQKIVNQESKNSLKHQLQSKYIKNIQKYDSYIIHNNLAKQNILATAVNKCDSNLIVSSPIEKAVANLKQATKKNTDLFIQNQHNVNIENVTNLPDTQPTLKTALQINSYTTDLPNVPFQNIACSEINDINNVNVTNSLPPISFSQKSNAILHKHFAIIDVMDQQMAYQNGNNRGFFPSPTSNKSEPQARFKPVAVFQNPVHFMPMRQSIPKEEFVASKVQDALNTTYVRCRPISIYNDVSQNRNLVPDTSYDSGYNTNQSDPSSAKLDLPPPPQNKCAPLPEIIQGKTIIGMNKYGLVTKINVPALTASKNLPINANNVNGLAASVNVIYPDAANSSVAKTGDESATHADASGTVVSNVGIPCAPNATGDNTKAAIEFAINTDSTSESPATLRAGNTSVVSDNISSIVSSKLKMLEELNNFTMIYDSHKPDLKRSLSNASPLEQRKAHDKIPKPGPLSKKKKINSTTDFQTQPELNKTAICFDAFSPPILPIPTFENALEYLAKANSSEPQIPMEYSRKFGIPKAKVENYPSNCIPAKRKNNVEEEKFTQEKSKKKITLDEYKKRVVKYDERSIDLSEFNFFSDTESETEIQQCTQKCLKQEDVRQNTELDQGYDSDATMKL